MQGKPDKFQVNLFGGLEEKEYIKGNNLKLFSGGKGG